MSGHRCTRIAGFIFALGLAAPAWGETIEFVTYYPAPTARGTANTQAMAVGTGYEGVTPDDGELLVFDRIGVGPGFDVAQPIARLHVVGGANQTNYAIFMPGAGGQMSVGIGTATPAGTNRLTVAGPWTAGPGGSQLKIHSTGNGYPTGISGIGLTSQNGTGEWVLARHDNAGQPGVRPANTFSIGVNGVDNWLDITPTGNVGIGTANPTTRLELPQNTALKLGQAYLSSGGDYTHLANNEWFNGAAWQANAAGALIQLAGQAINFYQHDAAGNHTGSVSITPAGNVEIGGVGVYNPDHYGKLHVYQPANNAWGAYVQGATYGLAGVAYGGGHPVHGWNGSYGNWGSLGYSSVGLYAYSPQANWASVANGAYYGSYGYGAYHGGYFQNANYWSTCLFAHNTASGYWSHIAYGYYGLYTNGYIYGYWASSKDYKKNITPLSAQEEASILSRIEKLPMVHYLYKTDKDDRAIRLGVTAETMPKDVTSEDGKGLEPSAYTAFALAGVKALSAQVKKQQETIESQQEELRELKRQVQQLQEKNTL